MCVVRRPLRLPPYLEWGERAKKEGSQLSGQHER